MLLPLEIRKALLSQFSLNIASVIYIGVILVKNNLSLILFDVGLYIRFANGTLEKFADNTFFTQTISSLRDLQTGKKNNLPQSMILLYEEIESIEKKNELKI